MSRNSANRTSAIFLEELLIPRLKHIGYRFGNRSWNPPDQLPEEELLRIQQEEGLHMTDIDHTAALKVSRALGHNRIDVLMRHYVQ